MTLMWFLFGFSVLVAILQAIDTWACTMADPAIRRSRFYYRGLPLVGGLLALRDTIKAERKPRANLEWSSLFDGDVLLRRACCGPLEIEVRPKVWADELAREVTITEVIDGKLGPVITRVTLSGKSTDEAKRIAEEIVWRLLVEAAKKHLDRGTEMSDATRSRLEAAVDKLPGAPRRQKPRPLVTACLLLLIPAAIGDVVAYRFATDATRKSMGPWCGIPGAGYYALWQTRHGGA